MEKFNTWEDSYTGTQPFLPLPRIPSFWLWDWTKRLLIYPVIAVTRLLLLFPLLGLLLLMDFIGLQIPISNLRRMFLRFFHFTLARSILFFMGFLSIEEKIMQTRRGATSSKQPWEGIESGHVIIANHSSYVELFYLLAKFSPQFTAVPNYWETSTPPSGIVQPQSFYSALTHTIYQLPSNKGQPFETVLKASVGPVVIFPEATTTNGKVLLGCVPVIPAETSVQKKLEGKVHILAFKYDYSEFSPVYTAGSFLWHLFQLCGQVSNKLQVRYTLESDIAVQPPDVSKELDPSWPERLYSLVASSLQKQRAKITAKEKQPFLQYFYSYRSTYKKKAH